MSHFNKNSKRKSIFGGGKLISTVNVSGVAFQHYNINKVLIVQNVLYNPLVNTTANTEIGVPHSDMCPLFEIRNNDLAFWKVDIFFCWYSLDIIYGTGVC